MKLKYPSLNNFFSSSGLILSVLPNEITVFINRVNNDGGTVENASGLGDMIDNLKNIS